MTGQVDKAGSWADKGTRPPGGEEEVTRRVGRGRLLGRYRLLQLIQRGKRTELYRAERADDQGKPAACAVKIVRGELETSVDAARDLSNEIQILSQLQHPNVVRLEDHGNVAGSLFLALELLDGRSVSRLLHSLSVTGGWMPPDLAAHVASEIALALSAVHRATVGSLGPTELVHRDLRPSHVMLLRTGGVKLIDFGAARGADRRLGRRRTQLDLGPGTAAYLAPEQVLGQPVDRRADLFSLGVVLWEMLAQRRLFRHETDQDTAAAVVEGPIPTLASLRSDIPPALETVVQQALQRDPQRRYQSAEEMAADLGRCTPGREAMARGISVLVEATMDLGVSGPALLPTRSPARRSSSRSAVPPASPAEKTFAVRRGRLRGLLQRLPIDRSRVRLLQAGALAVVAFASGAFWQKGRLEQTQARRAVTVPVSSAAQVVVPPARTIAPPAADPVPLPPADRARAATIEPLEPSRPTIRSGQPKSRGAAPAIRRRGSGRPR
jgi:eukaryotic-like serine/threonine-protein kinase